MCRICLVGYWYGDMTLDGSGSGVPFGRDGNIYIARDSGGSKHDG